MPSALTLVSHSAYCSILKTEAIYSSEMSVDFQRITRRFIPEDRTLLILFVEEPQNELLPPGKTLRPYSAEGGSGFRDVLSHYLYNEKQRRDDFKKNVTENFFFNSASPLRHIQLASKTQRRKFTPLPCNI